VPVQTVVETGLFQKRAAKRLSPDEVVSLVNAVAADPAGGTSLGAGLWKIRFGTAGRGKRGGVRVIYAYWDGERPIYLLTVFAKNEQDNLSAGELAELVGIAKMLEG
jgi:hypothetical protein